MKKNTIKVKIGDRTWTADLADNPSVDAFCELLSQGPLVLNMEDFAGMEKGAPLPETLPESNESMHTEPGDIILYQGRQLVIYYDENDWSLTPIARLQDVDAADLREALGRGDVQVCFEREDV